MPTATAGPPTRSVPSPYSKCSTLTPTFNFLLDPHLLLSREDPHLLLPREDPYLLLPREDPNLLLPSEDLHLLLPSEDPHLLLPHEDHLSQHNSLPR